MAQVRRILALATAAFYLALLTVAGAPALAIVMGLRVLGFWRLLERDLRQVRRDR